MKNFLLLSLFISFDAAAIISGESFDIKFGYLSINGSGEYFISKETNRIPLRLKNTGFRWGYIIRSGVPSFTTHNISRSESPFTEVTNYTLEEDGSSLRSETSPVTGGYYVEIIWHDHSDPLGNQTLEVYINDNLERVIDFTVVADKKK